MSTWQPNKIRSNTKFEVTLLPLRTIFLLLLYFLLVFAGRDNTIESESCFVRGKSHFSKPSRFTGRKVLLIHICFQWRTKPNRRRQVIPNKNRPLAASACVSPRRASIEAWTRENTALRLQTSAPAIHRNSGMNVDNARVSKKRWNKLMYLAVEGANALSDSISTEYPFGRINTSNKSSRTRILQTTLSKLRNLPGKQMQSQHSKARSTKTCHLHSNNGNFVVEARRQKCEVDDLQK